MRAYDSSGVITNSDYMFLGVNKLKKMVFCVLFEEILYLCAHGSWSGVIRR